MKVLFWNAAGVKKDHMGDMSAAMSILLPVDADVVIIGEVLKGYRGTLRGMGTGGEDEPIDTTRWYKYHIVKPGKALGNYGAGKSGDPDFQKRYLVLVRVGLPHQAYYVGSGKPRPGVVVDVLQGSNVFRIMAIHAPSVTSTYKPQAEAVLTALATIAGQGDPISSRMPNLILGDVNIRARDPSHINAFMTYQPDGAAAPLSAAYAPLVPVTPTHRRPDNSWNTLDWALVPIASHAAFSIETVNTADKFAKDKEDFVPAEELVDKSDHVAILVKTP